MKTMDEIVERINAGGFDSDIFGFGSIDLYNALDYEHASPLLSDEGRSKYQDNWDSEQYRFKTDDDVIKEMKDYMSFARDKCDNERGLSANRSINHYIAWAWLIDDELYEKLEHMYDTEFAPYGKPILDHIECYLER